MIEVECHFFNTKERISMGVEDGGCIFGKVNCVMGTSAGWIYYIKWECDVPESWEYESDLKKVTESGVETFDSVADSI